MRFNRNNPVVFLARFTQKHVIQTVVSSILRARQRCQGNVTGIRDRVRDQGEIHFLDRVRHNV